MPQAPVSVWFEIPASDFPRAVTFYETVFQTRLQPESCNVSGMKMAVFPHEPTQTSGCIIHAGHCQPSPTGTVVYLNGGDDLSGPLSRVEAAGGQVVTPKTLITDDIGYFALFLDTEGNRVGLHSMN